MPRSVKKASAPSAAIVTTTRISDANRIALDGAFVPILFSSVDSFSISLFAILVYRERPQKHELHAPRGTTLTIRSRPLAFYFQFVYDLLHIGTCSASFSTLARSDCDGTLPFRVTTPLLTS